MYCPLYNIILISATLLKTLFLGLGSHLSGYSACWASFKSRVQIPIVSDSPDVHMVSWREGILSKLPFLRVHVSTEILLINK